MMQVIVDRYAGFCPGVVRAVTIAEKYLQTGEQLYCLGEIVHNEMEVDRLEKLGMRTIAYEEFRELKNTRVLLRSHGEPPETYKIAKKNNITLIDATCGIVTKLQKKVRKAGEKGKKDSGQVVIYGKSKHPEVVSLKGQTGNDALVIEQEKDLEQIDYSKPVRLFSQTTMQTEKFLQVEKSIAKGMKDHQNDELESTNSICKQVSNRVPRLKEFAAEHDVILFVSGKNSSNGKFLYSICKSVNENTYFVSGISELQASWFKDVDTVGVTGATSTPDWLLEQVADELKRY